jgi:hypothetical protein
MIIGLYLNRTFNQDGQCSLIKCHMVCYSTNSLTYYLVNYLPTYYPPTHLLFTCPPTYIVFTYLNSSH